MKNIRSHSDHASRGTTLRGASLTLSLIILLTLGASSVPAQERPEGSTREETADALVEQPQGDLQVVRGAERGAPVTPFVFEGDLRDLPAPVEWKPGDPVKEIPVARRLAHRYDERATRTFSVPDPGGAFAVDPYRYQRRPTLSIASVGGESPVRVEVDLGPVADDVEALAGQIK